MVGTGSVSLMGGNRGLINNVVPYNENCFMVFPLTWLWFDSFWPLLHWL